MSEKIQLVMARMVAALPSFELAADATSAPAEIQFMPPGRHKITAKKDDKKKTFVVKVHEGTARVLAKSLQALRTKAAANDGDLPYFDFDHKDGEASAHPTEFFWAGTDPKTGGVRCKLEWTKPGADAIVGRAYRRFSPSFYVNDDGEVFGAEINMGGLVNRAAFRTIAPVWAKDGELMEDEEFTPGNPTEEVEEPGNETNGGKAAAKGTVMTEAEMQAALTAKETELASLKAKLTTMEEAAKVQAKNQAKELVLTAVKAGKIEPKNTALITHLEEIAELAPVQARGIIAGMQVNPAFLTVVTDASGADKTDKTTDRVDAKGEKTPPTCAEVWNASFKDDAKK